MRAFTLTVLAAILLAACGGSDDDGGASEEDFIGEVDAICLDTARQVTELYATEGTPQSNEELEAFLRQRIPISEEAQADAKAIEPPEDLADQYDAYLAERQKVGDLLREQAKSAAAGDGRRAIEIDGELAAVTESLDASAADLGLHTCAGRLPPEQEAEVVAVLERVQTTADPAQCSDDYTAELVEAAGGAKVCASEERRSEATQPDSVEVTNIEGADSLTATAITTSRGGRLDGRVAEISLTYEDGRWKVSGVTVKRK